MAKAEYKSAIRSRRMIQRALVELLQEKELDKITVTDIVTRADINRGTFYAHYADISGVLDSIMENVCQTIREALEKQPLWAKAPRCTHCAAALAAHAGKRPGILSKCHPHQCFQHRIGKAAGILY